MAAYPFSTLRPGTGPVLAAALLFSVSSVAAQSVAGTSAGAETPADTGTSADAATSAGAGGETTPGAAKSEGQTEAAVSVGVAPDDGLAAGASKKASSVSPPGDAASPKNSGEGTGEIEPSDGVDAKVVNIEGAEPDSGKPSEVEVTPTAVETSEGAWRGPNVEIGYGMYRIDDGHGGMVHAGRFGGYFLSNDVLDGMVRLGGFAELGARDYTLGIDDGVFRGFLVAGFQAPGFLIPQLNPYVAFIGSGGVMFGSRFEEPFLDTLYGFGLEAGIDFNVVNGFFVGVGAGVQRLIIDGLRYDSWTLRLAVGL